ncbi:MAG TPA: hypothetical protein VM365_11050 [Gemmatimonadales bacterium]|jgi:hypothetical protein|nr:hypothetical protein [Gemmatimonadales bacterium]
MRIFLLEVLMHPFFRSRYPRVLVALALASATPGVAQDMAIRRNHIAVDVGILQGGLSYARRVSQKFSIGGGIWAAWEPWSSFDSSILEPVGVELFVRAHPSRDVHLEVGPSVLRYYSQDDCSECTETFTGIRTAAMVGKGVFSLGPTARFGRVTGGSSGSELGVIFGVQLRLLFGWGE